jgi:hypothetical protein
METCRSAILTPNPSFLSQLSDKQALMARGKTYKAISPLFLLCSIQMLDPQIKEAMYVQPNGPSK